VAVERQSVENGLHERSYVLHVRGHWSVYLYFYTMAADLAASYSSIMILLLLLLLYVHSLLHSAQIRPYTIYYLFGIPNQYAMIIPLYTRR